MQHYTPIENTLGYILETEIKVFALTKKINLNS